MIKKKTNSPEYLKVVESNLKLNLDIKNNVSCKFRLIVKYKVAKSYTNLHRELNYVISSFGIV